LTFSTTNFNEEVLGRCELILMALGCPVPPGQQPATNFNERLIELLDHILSCITGGVPTEGGETIALASDYAPQASNGDPNFVLTARWDYDLAIDTANHELYYSTSEGSDRWIVLCPAQGLGGS